MATTASKTSGHSLIVRYSVLWGGIGLVIVCIVYAWCLTGRFFSIMNDPYIATAAQVARGARLYADTVAVITPLSILYVALLFRVFGITTTVSELGSGVIGSLEGLWIFGLGRKLRLSTLWCLVAVLFSLVWGNRLGVIGQSASPYLSLGAFFATGAVFFMVSEKRLYGTVLAGVCAGLAFWTYQPSGVQVLGTFLVWAILKATGVIPSTRPKRTLLPALRETGLFVTGVALVSLGVGLWAYRQHVGELMQYYTLKAPQASGSSYLWQWELLARHIYPTSLSMAGIKQFLGLIEPHPFAFAAWVGVMVSWLRTRPRYSSETSSVVGALVVFSGMGFIMSLWHPVTCRILVHVMPALGLVVCWGISTATASRRRRMPPAWAAAILAVFLVFGIGRTVHNILWRDQTHWQTSRTSMWMLSEDKVWLERTIGRIHKDQGQGGSCFILGRGGLLHILSETWPAGRHSISTAVLLGPNEYRQCWEEIRRQRPNYIYGWMISPDDLLGKPFAKLLSSNLNIHYAIQTTLKSHAGTFIVWKAKPDFTERQEQQGSSESARSGESPELSGVRQKDQ